jgi:DNA polymerase III subunit delta'
MTTTFLSIFELLTYIYSMLFKQIIGQDRVKSTLRQMVETQRISHGLLFSGKEGSGHLPLALAFAQYIFCSNRKDNDACGQCPSCLKLNKLAHPDLHMVYPIASGKDVKVSTDVMGLFREEVLRNPYLNLNDWFEALDAANKQPIISAEESNDILKKLSYTAFEGGYKLMIIWYPEKMNATSANKLLKILEEPPELTLFFLVTSAPDQIIGTILSRTQLINLDLIEETVLAKEISTYYKLNESDALNVARLAEGSWRSVQSIMEEQEDMVALVQHFQSLMRLALKFDAIKANQWIEQTAALGRERQKQFFQYGLHLLREAIMINYGAANLVKLRGDELSFIQKFAPFIHAINEEVIIDIFEQAYYAIERNANPKILLMDIVLKLNEWINKKKAA